MFNKSERCAAKRALRAAGICLTCWKRPVLPNRKYCAHCQELDRQRSERKKSRRADAITRGICGACLTLKAERACTLCVACADLEAHRSAVRREFWRRSAPRARDMLANLSDDELIQLAFQLGIKSLSRSQLDAKRLPTVRDGPPSMTDYDRRIERALTRHRLKPASSTPTNPPRNKSPQCRTQTQPHRT